MSNDKDAPKTVRGEVLAPGEKAPGERFRPAGIFSRARSWVDRKATEEEVRLVQAQTELTEAHAKGVRAQSDLDLAISQIDEAPERARKSAQAAVNDRVAEEQRAKELERQAVEEETRRLEAERVRDEEKDRQGDREQHRDIERLKLELEKAELEAKLAKLRGDQQGTDRTPRQQIDALKQEREQILAELEAKRADGTLTLDQEKQYGEHLQGLQSQIDELTRAL